jgi:hypothetical protein
VGSPSAIISLVNALWCLREWMAKRLDADRDDEMVENLKKGDVELRPCDRWSEVEFIR